MVGKQRYSAEQVSAAIEQTKGLLYLAAKRLGCSYHTLLNYVQRYPTVQATMEAQRGELVDTAELKLYESILKGEPWGITLCLKTLGRDRGYVERTEVTDVRTGEGLARLLEAHRTRQRARGDDGRTTRNGPRERGGDQGPAPQTTALRGRIPHRPACDPGGHSGAPADVAPAV
jgi:hypothetical protein